MYTPCLVLLALLSAIANASRFDPAEVDWNINTNQLAVAPLDYSTSWPDHAYTPSPRNWRFPFYSLFLDKFVNGEPSNDNANGTAWEHDVMGTQLRHGGDIQGLVDSLDYLHGLGIRGLYIAGSILMNLPWSADSYSPLDHSLVDHHFGTVEQWRAGIQAIHDKGMYIIVDNTMATMSNLIGFDGYANASTPWDFQEHGALWRSDRHYRDYDFGNNWEPECEYSYPRFWDQEGQRIIDNNTQAMIGCRDSEFDQFGDVGAFGIYPEWQKQLSKFNSVQDRLREWRPSVMAKIQHFSCMTIQGLDVDGFRIDKALQVTVDSQGNFSHAMRECAAGVGKHNFFIPGEIVNGNANGAIYLGRGKEPEMQVDNLTAAVTSNVTQYIRDAGYQALDAAAFHYSTYRGLMRFLGFDGSVYATKDTPVNFVDAWNVMMQTNDLHNANTGEFDPRHMYGVSNQDVFRWPGLTNGTQRQLLGAFITTLEMPGIPLLSWGEEQAFYVLDNTAPNYVYGRQAMSSAQAWQMHGCYKVGTVNLNNSPFNSSLFGCQDDSVSLDHRDPTHPVYNVYKTMFELRERYPVLNDGWTVRRLSNQTFEYTLPSSMGQPTETGLYSVLRSRFEGVQDFTGEGMFGNQNIWLLYSNLNRSKTYTSDCTDNLTAIISPFDPNATVKNLFYPFDEWTLETSTLALGIDSSSNPNGCLSRINMTEFGWKAFVPIQNWTRPSPGLTKFSPGHDARILSSVGPTEQEHVPIELDFSDLMDCDSVHYNINISSSTDDGTQAQLDSNSVNCLTIDPTDIARYSGPAPSIWRFKATLTNVSNGIHIIKVNNATNQDKNTSTNSNTALMFRIGQSDNPMVFPFTANYSSSLLYRQTNTKRSLAYETGSGYIVNHKAAGADMWRFTLSFGGTWSDWMPYVPGNATLPALSWNGTKAQTWTGDHVRVQYWSQKAGSSDHVQEGDTVGSNANPRRFPHLFIHGEFNQFGFDSGLSSSMQQDSNGTWAFNFMAEWPTQFQVNVWGMGANGLPDVSYAFGDVDNDTVLDRIAPDSLEECVVNITNFGPESPYLSWKIMVNDGDYRYWLVPAGNRWAQLAMYILMAIIPPATAILGVYLYQRFFYGVKFNQIGLTEPKHFLPIAIRNMLQRSEKMEEKDIEPTVAPASPEGSIINAAGFGAIVQKKRRTVLIGTMEYDISDWNIKIKIGGLGVMAQLMGKNLSHQDLVWVVPCAGGIDYPMDTPGLPIDVMILGRTYEVQVQYHKLNNITYMLLDAPVFRRQTQTEPYPARMDDLDSAIYYSAWNQCIAEAMRRFPVDLYHINDYHGTVAPLYLLPDTIPCCLSLHNAEFQGLWPMRNPHETEEICSVFNLPQPVVQRYVQFGEVFNLLHAGASILRINQKGFGAVGVSKKYGKRSWARYPIFWGLKGIGALPNPDPSDVAEWDKKLANPDEITVDPVFESARAGLKRQAQEWAGLEQRADAELFVFVGRWSMQKGIDLIADVFPGILEQYPQTQLVCVGPTIDLYGKFAALKLDIMMKKYPGRVYSKPQFTALPPFIFSGAEFALIPSRDEPFGLVAVEFGRKGALGVGSRVGGLGQMPGWWFTVESTTTKHLMHQFKMAIHSALKSNYDTRAIMRARSAKQRFPVNQWKEDLEILQSSAIKVHNKRMERLQNKHLALDTGTAASSGWNTPYMPGWRTPRSGWGTPTGSGTPTGGSPSHSRSSTRPSSPTTGTPQQSGQTTPSISRQGSLSLGMRQGPGHSPPNLLRRQNSRPPPTRSNTFRRNSLEHGDGYHHHLSSIKDEVNISSEHAEEAKRRSRMEATIPYAFNSELRNPHQQPQQVANVQSPFYTLPPTPDAETPQENYPFLREPHTPIRSDTASHDPLNVEKVMNEKANQKPQDLMPFFTDPTGLYYKTFERKLADLDGKTSEGNLCIEDYIEKSEKQWFNRLHNARMTPGNLGAPRGGFVYDGMDGHEERMSQFLLPANYAPPTGLQRILRTKIGDWPVYAFLIALGQILAANSYQITLLTGQNGQSATQLYCIASIYLVASLGWWIIFRKFACLYCMTTPWLFYGFAFFLLGMAPWASSTSGRGWIQNVATAMYAVASASGSLFFAQNFGSMGSAPVKTWGFRACMIQGTQQLYIVGLWFWGSELTAASNSGQSVSSRSTYGGEMTAVCIPIAVFLWAIGAVLFIGLPEFYRQKPGGVPSFYSSVFRRKIIVWFFVAVFVQNLFLSAPYGRNWKYLFNSKHAPGWAIFLMILLFFVVIWAIILRWFSHLSDTHSWIIPMFAVGLLAPRWCQILWSTSSIGAYLPWAGGPIASALLGRALWLWLGVLDSLQGIGFGMILLQTLTRFHLSYTLVTAQMVGSIATIIARADGLNSVGPGQTFPDLSGDISNGLSQPWFWIALLFQLAIAAGFFKFFRGEQLSKP